MSNASGENETRSERGATDGVRLASLLDSDELIELLVRRIPPGVPFPDWSKSAFLKSLEKTSRILDVGCGNNSPYHTKQILPDCHYVGLDIGDYNQSKPNLADEYIVTSPGEFCGRINAFKDSFDALVCSHNLEHCDDREGTLRAMAQALKSGGRIYISFPCSQSVGFPSRGGCLNYYDDATHQYAPPDFADVIAALHAEGLRVLYANTRYQSPLEWIVGLRNEAESVAAFETRTGTWSLWGFETIIWAEKK